MQVTPVLHKCRSTSSAGLWNVSVKHLFAPSAKHEIICDCLSLCICVCMCACERAQACVMRILHTIIAENVVRNLKKNWQLGPKSLLQILVDLDLAVQYWIAIHT